MPWRSVETRTQFSKLRDECLKRIFSIAKAQCGLRCVFEVKDVIIREWTQISEY
jgi:hypothetical protein